MEFPGLARYEIQYGIAGDGVIEIAVQFDPFSDWFSPMPRLGLRLGLDRTLDRVIWYGRGPQETHTDRKLGAKIGVYDLSIELMHHPYVWPQLNGNRTDVRWVKFLNGSGKA